MLRNLLPLALSPALIIPTPAAALDVDRIELRSGLGQPLLAEIPVVAPESDELSRLQAGLASATTFARIGLPRPQGVILQLRFGLARDAAGKPVIRVTTAAPVDEEFLTFLVQVDWGDGRLVREYSIALRPPDTLPTALPPVIETPRSEGALLPGRVAPVQASDSVVAIPLLKDTLRTEQTARAPSEEDAPLRPRTGALPFEGSRASIPATGWSGRRYGPVRRGDTLGRIAASFAGDDLSLNQAMLALLRVNADAFVGGNVNLLRSGAILRAPPPDELRRISAAEADAIVHEHIQAWRSGRPLPGQPAALPLASEHVPAQPRGSAPTPAAPRLEITPGPPLGQRLQAQSAAGGHGRMLVDIRRQASATQREEVDELRVRVAELEALQRRQRAFIALQDAKLASLEASRMPWTWLLLACGFPTLLAWWRLRREPRSGWSEAAADDQPAWHRPAALLD